MVTNISLASGTSERIRPAASMPFTRRQPDIEHDHIRSQCLCLTDALEAIASFTNDQYVRPLSQQLAENPAERPVVLDDEHTMKSGQ